MSESVYLERTKIEGSFRTKDVADHWVREKVREGYSVTAPFENPFAYSNEAPWEATASACFTVEARWS